MGTHCSIQVEGMPEVVLYKHYDGYPDEMQKPLEEFNKDFNDKRGPEAGYKFAQLVRQSAELFDSHEKYTGWGVYSGDLLFVNFKYVLKVDGSVTCEKR